MDDKLVSSETLESLIIQRVEKINTCQDTTKSYIVGLLKSYIKEPIRFDNKSIGLDYLQACHNIKFEKFQHIGDWIFFIESNYPQYFDDSSKRYYISIGKNSYYKCFILLNKQWNVFEELADNFDIYAEKIYSTKKF